MRPVSQIRRGAEIPQRVIAAAFDVPRSTYSRYERGLVRRPKHTHVTRDAMLDAIHAIAVEDGHRVQIDLEDLL